MSLGPGSAMPPPLGDATARHNRRTSFGGKGSPSIVGSNNKDSSSSPTDQTKDRRAMLEEWRRNRAGGSSSQPAPPAAAPSPARHRPSSAPSPSKAASSTSGLPLTAPSPTKAAYSFLASRSPARKSRRDETQTELTIDIPLNMESSHQQPQPQPPSSAPSSSTIDLGDLSALTPLERYRLRKLHGIGPGGGSAAGLPPTPSNSSSAGFTGGTTTHTHPSGSIGTPSRGGGRKAPPLLPPSHSSSSAGGGSAYANGEEEEATTITTSYSLGTPSRRGKSRGGGASLAGGAQRRVRRRTSLAPSSELLPPTQPSGGGGDQGGGRSKSKPLLPPSYPSSNERSHDKLEAAEECQLQQQQQQQQVSLASVEREMVIEQPPQNYQAAAATAPSFTQDGIDSIDSAAMKSRIHAMQKQIDRLEREKMELSMSKAPLEARIRQKEDAWMKERERLCAEIESHQVSSKEVDERYRELEMRTEALEEQNTRLRLEARANNAMSNGSSMGGGGSGDSWSERLNSNKEIKDLRKEIKNKDDEIKSLRIEKVSLESEVFGCQQEIETLERNYDDLENDYRELSESKSQNAEAEIQLEALSTEYTAMSAQLNATCADLEEIKTRAKADLQAKEDGWKSRESDLLFEMSVLKSRAGKGACDDASLDDGEGEEDPAILKARIEERDRRITELEEQLLSGEQLRRALHNRIQELRGNIRVFVRTRPFLPNDGVAGHSSIDFLPDGESLSIQGKHVGESHAFKFDKVFAPSTGQDMVFDEVSEFVQSALDGYHVCLFSYGQVSHRSLCISRRLD